MTPSEWLIADYDQKITKFARYIDHCVDGVSFKYQVLPLDRANQIYVHWQYGCGLFDLKASGLACTSQELTTMGHTQMIDNDRPHP